MFLQPIIKVFSKLPNDKMKLHPFLMLKEISKLIIKIYMILLLYIIVLKFHQILPTDCMLFKIICAALYMTYVFYTHRIIYYKLIQLENAYHITAHFRHLPHIDGYESKLFCADLYKNLLNYNALFHILVYTVPKNALIYALI